MMILGYMGQPFLWSDPFHYLSRWTCDKSTSLREAQNRLKEASEWARDERWVGWFRKNIRLFFFFVFFFPMGWIMLDDKYDDKITDHFHTSGTSRNGRKAKPSGWPDYWVFRRFLKAWPESFRDSYCSLWDHWKIIVKDHGHHLIRELSIQNWMNSIIIPVGDWILDNHHLSNRQWSSNYCHHPDLKPVDDYDYHDNQRN